MIYRLVCFALVSLIYTIPPLENRKRVVIIGGGFAGSYAAQSLEDYFDVTLIDSKDYFEFTPSVLRTIVEPTHIRRLQILHNHYLKAATFIQKEALRVEVNRVILDDRAIPFDYLIINSGTSYSQPFKENRILGSARANMLRENTSIVKKAKKILIIGGGLVGVELAAEIVCHHKGKEVVIVHSQSTLINRFPKRAIRYTEEFLKSRGVTVLYNERVIGHKGQTFVTDQGTEVAADAAFLCTGIKANSGFLKEHFSDTISESGFVHSNEYLQLAGQVIYPHMFVAGDVLDVREEKLAQGAEAMAALVVSNIFSMERGRRLSKYTSPPARPILISLGKYHGVFVYGGWAIPGPFPALLKEAVEWKTLVRYF